jgi:hypothetical protein
MLHNEFVHEAHNGGAEPLVQLLAGSTVAVVQSLNQKSRRGVGRFHDIQSFLLGKRAGIAALCQMAFWSNAGPAKPLGTSAAFYQNSAYYTYFIPAQKTIVRPT